MTLMNRIFFALLLLAGTTASAQAPAKTDTTKACDCPPPTVGPLDRVRPLAPNVANGNVSGVDRKNLSFGWTWTDEGKNCVTQTVVYDAKECTPGRVNVKRCSQYDFPVRSLTWELVVVEAGAKMPKGKEAQDLIDGKIIAGATAPANVIYRSTGRPRTLCNPNGNVNEPLYDWSVPGTAVAGLPWTNGTWYAWQVTVRINNTTVEKSRVWGFRVMR